MDRNNFKILSKMFFNLPFYSNAFCTWDFIWKILVDVFASAGLTDKYSFIAEIHALFKYIDLSLFPLPITFSLHSLKVISLILILLLFFCGIVFCISGNKFYGFRKIHCHGVPEINVVDSVVWVLDCYFVVGICVYTRVERVYSCAMSQWVVVVDFSFRVVDNKLDIGSQLRKNDTADSWVWSVFLLVVLTTWIYSCQCESSDV